MGIYDRDYYRNPGGGQGQAGRWASTAVGTVILLNVGCWFLQLMSRSGPGDFSTVGEWMSSSGNSIFASDLGFPELWRLVTACFVHSESSIWHLGGNMFIFWMFGRELERMYGRREFWIFYLFGGTLAVLVESLVQFQQDTGGIPILGASGGVMAVAALYIFHFPRRTVLLYFLFPIPLWVLGCIYVYADISGALGGSGGYGVANFAHLGGAAWGMLYKLFDLRWSTLRRRLGGLRRRKKKTGGRGNDSRWGARKQEKPRVPDAVSRRVDELLEKISRDGMGGLSDEEREFLVENSRRYRKS